MTWDLSPISAGTDKYEYCGRYGAAKKTKPSTEQMGAGQVATAATKAGPSELSEAE